MQVCFPRSPGRAGLFQVRCLALGLRAERCPARRLASPQPAVPGLAELLLDIKTPQNFVSEQEAELKLPRAAPAVPAVPGSQPRGEAATPPQFPPQQPSPPPEHHWLLKVLLSLINRHRESMRRRPGNGEFVLPAHAVFYPQEQLRQARVLRCTGLD